MCVAMRIWAWTVSALLQDFINETMFVRALLW